MKKDNEHKAVIIGGVIFLALWITLLAALYLLTLNQ